MKFIDMHCDTLMGAYNHPDFSLLNNEKTMVDFTRMRRGGQMAQFFAMFLPPPNAYKRMGLEKPIDDDDYINQLSACLRRELEANSDLIAFAGSADDLLANDRAGKMSAFLTIEDGRSVQGSMDKLQHYYDLGVRLISLTWNFKNCFGTPNSKDPALMAEGLTDFGKDAILRMNELGMLVDVSHLSDGGFWDVARLSQKPFVASHSNCRALSPHPRNLTDEMIRALADKGGVSGLNFCGNFLNADIDCEDSRAEAIVSHILHFINVGGSDCVALGSDLDGIGGNLEVGSSDQIPVLFDLLSKRGVSDDMIEKVAYQNALRVIRDSMK